MAVRQALPPLLRQGSPRPVEGAATPESPATSARTPREGSWPAEDRPLPWPPVCSPEDWSTGRGLQPTSLRPVSVAPRRCCALDSAGGRVCENAAVYPPNPSSLSGVAHPRLGLSALPRSFQWHESWNREAVFEPKTQLCPRSPEVRAERVLGTRKLCLSHQSRSRGRGGGAGRLEAALAEVKSDIPVPCQSRGNARKRPEL